MKFYNREKELALLEKMRNRASKKSKMTVMVGRRRIGKTVLALKSVENKKYLYFFVSKKSEQILVEEYLKEIQEKFELPVTGKITKFKEVFALLMQISEQTPFTLIIDEFQEFYTINPAIYSELQNIWDLNKNKSKLNLIFIGSIYSLMNKIFQNSREPLFGRADKIMSIKPFSLKTVFKILKNYKSANFENLFAYYLFNGGMPRYIEIFIENKIFTQNDIINFMIDTDSPFLYEGKNVLIEEFGRDHDVHFSILQLIASGKSARSEIESILERNVGGYLDRLVNDFGIIKSIKPIGSKPGGRIQKYEIIDNFLMFWFRFIYQNYSAVESKNFVYLKALINRDISTYAGKILERFFQEIFLSSEKYNQVGNYWEKGNQNEIDLVAINDLEKKIVIADIKLNPDKINLNEIKYKSQNLLRKFADYKVEFLGLSPENALNYLQS